MKNNVVFTNGCFYLLHPGHIDLFKKIKELYPCYRLVVGLNSSESIMKIKEKRSEIFSDEDRVFMLESIKYVDEVRLFNEVSPIELIKKIKPAVIVKGADYLRKGVIGSDLVSCVSFINFEKNYSTTEIIRKLFEIYSCSY